MVMLMSREKQKELFAIRSLEHSETEAGRLMAQFLKRKSEITFYDEDKRLPERTKYEPYESFEKMFEQI